jgi:hypothetical protein
MKKNETKDELRSEYKRDDLGKGVRGKYYKEFKKGHNLVLLEPEVAKVFPDDKSVNDALRSLMESSRSSADLAE